MSKRTDPAHKQSPGPRYRKLVAVIAAIASVFVPFMLVAGMRSEGIPQAAMFLSAILLAAVLVKAAIGLKLNYVIDAPDYFELRDWPSAPKRIVYADLAQVRFFNEPRNYLHLLDTRGTLIKVDVRYYNAPTLIARAESFERRSARPA
ncbi:MAG: hypothetical protein MR522_04955 [Trueperella sp.]|uniref:hypothetical protein n=1 Tax=Trueperella TaxID=1069494 RepID=UPI0025EBB858|nr:MULTISPECIES: hypothetical protein [Trueperella]MCI7305598.1 hypothetical protein [Trueperella sp.]